MGWSPRPVAAAETRGCVYFGDHGTCAARVFSRALLWGGVEWADPQRVFSNFRLFCGQTEGTSAFSAVELAIKCASRACVTPWAVAAMHRGRDIKNARNTPSNNLLGMTSLGNSRKNRGRPIRPQITRGSKSGEADRSRPCEHRGISFRKSYAKFSPFLYEFLYVCCCRTREPRARRRPVFRSPGGGAGYHRRPICVAWRGLLITCLSTRGFVIQRRPP